MIKKLFLDGYLDYRHLILRNYKDLNISEVDAIILIKILEINQRGKKITISKVATETKLSKKEVEVSMSSLIEKTIIDIYIEYKNGIGDESYSFAPLFKKIEEIFKDEEPINNTPISQIITILEQELKRPMTPVELTICSEWIDKDKCSLEEIKTAIFEAVKVNRVNFKYIEQQLLSNSKKQFSVAKKIDKKTADKLEMLYDSF